MKSYIKKASALLPVLLFLSSCQEFLHVKPVNVQAISTYEDVRGLLGASLRVYAQGNDWDRMQGVDVFYTVTGEYLITHFYTDDYDPSHYLDTWVGENNRGDFYRSLNWNHPDIAEEIWTNYYKNIGFYNMILQELEKYPSESQTLNDQVSGEARVLRAWQFFRLMQYFSPYHESKLGLPLNTDSDAVGSYDRRRCSQEENYAFVISELEEVLSYSGEPSESYNIFFDPTFIHGLLAQVYLWKGDSGAKEEKDYLRAIEHAEYVLSQGKSYTYTDRLREDPNSFIGIKKDKEYAVISAYENNWSYAQDIAGNPAWGLPQYASKSLLTLYRDEDRRRSDYFYEDGSIRKLEYMGYQMCIDFMTGAEMQLIIAESYARMGRESEAWDALSAFGASRYEGGYTHPVGLSALDAVLRERRMEFCFEYTMRWLDLTRLQDGFSRPAVDKNDGSTYTLEDGDFRFAMPIPRNAELNENPIEQNPGWNNF